MALDNIEIGERLRQYREYLGHTREEFAKTLRISVGNYKRIESGKVKLSTDKIAMLCHTYGKLDVAWLLWNEQPKIHLFGREFSDIDTLWNETNEEEKEELVLETVRYALEKLKDNKASLR